jgi:hypothetical protein
MAADTSRADRFADAPEPRSPETDTATFVLPDAS